MINYEKLLHIYNGILYWVAKRSSKNCLEFYNNNLEEIGYAIQSINEVFDKFCSTSFRKEDAGKIFKDAFNKAKQDEQEFALFVLFTFKNDIKHNVFDVRTPSLSDYLIDIKDNTYREKYTFEQNGYTYVPNYILTYRDVNWPVFYDEGSSSDYVRFMDKNHKEVNFPLIWDWDYPIDEYLDIGSGEENKIIL